MRRPIDLSSSRGRPNGENRHEQRTRAKNNDMNRTFSQPTFHSFNADQKRRNRHYQSQPLTEATDVDVFDDLRQRAVAEQDSDEPEKIRCWKRYKAEMCAER